jgi:hypothetical protein
MTATAPRFFTARSAGRYRVFEVLADGTEIERAVVASKAKGAEKVAKLEAEAAPAAPLEVVTLDGEEAQAAEEDATREFVVEATNILTGAPEVKPLPERPITQNTLAAVEAETKAYRIGKVLREFILASVTPADSDLVAHIASRNVCYDGTATLRVTAKWAQELSWLATDLENAAVKDDSRVAAKAPAIMAARSARKTLGNLF